MNRRARILGTLAIAAVVLGGCLGSEGSSPSASPSAAPPPLDVAAVTVALKGAGVAVVDVANDLNIRDGAWKCVPGIFRLARVSQQAAGVLQRPGGPPAIDILVFPSDALRATAQAAIGSDGQVHTPGCAVMVDWVGKPHVIGVKNVILFVATDDPATVAAVEAAAKTLRA